MKKIVVIILMLTVFALPGMGFIYNANANQGNTAEESGKYIKLAGGLNGSENIQVTRSGILSYMNKDFDKLTRGMLASLMGQNGDIWFPEEVPVSFKSKIYEPDVSYRVALSLNGDLSESEYFTGNNDYPGQSDGAEGCIFISNLMVGKKYYYRIEATTKSEKTYYSLTGSFTTDATPARWISLSGSISNTRDTGGWQTESGQIVKQGLIYRGGRIQETNGVSVISEEVADYIVDKLAIKTDVDLRGVYGDMVTATKSIGGKINFLSVPIYAYEDALTNNTTAVNIKRIFDTMSKQSNYPLYIHCSAGADRTGTLVFIINGLLGVSYENLLRDFELTSFSDQTIRYRDDDMLAVYNAINKYGTDRGAANFSESCEKWLCEYVGVSSENIAAVKNILLED